MVEDGQASSLVQDAIQTFRGDPRKQHSYERWQVIEENYEGLIAGRIAATHEDPSTIARMVNWVDVSSNLALDILGQIAVVYKNGATRTVQGATDRQNGELRSVYDQMCIDAVAMEWNSQGFYFNELLAMPQVVDGDPVMHTCLPHMYEAITHPKNPQKDIGYIYTVNPRLSGVESDHAQLDPRRADVDYAVVDDRSWRTYSGQTGELIDLEHHDLGYVPAVRLSYSKGFGGTRWCNAKRNQRLHDATLAASLVSTTMGYVRKVQNRHILAAIGAFDVNDATTVDPETGVKIEAQSPELIDIKTLPFDTDPINFIRQLAWIYQSVAQGFGGFADFDESKGKSGTFTVAFSHDTQAELRNRQLPFARNFEKQLAATTVDVMRAANHPSGAKMPDPDKIREDMTIDFGRLSRKFANPKEEIEYFNFLKENAATHQLELIRQNEGGTLSDERLESILKENIEKQAWIYDFQAKRNLPLTSGGGVTTDAALNGEKGPEVRDGKPDSDESAED